MAKKATFAAASFSNLRAAAGESAGEPLRIPLVDIDEDPKQPRQTFDQAELESLALTIRDRGILQPIGVQPPADGRYVLVFGARRLRASKLAGQADIPAVIVPEGQRDFATQVIENQQRANLSNSELAAAVNQLAAEGKQGKEIAAICNLKDWQIAAYRAVVKLPDFLLQRLNHGDMRAIYDLYRAWQKHPAPIQDAMPDEGTFLTITEARRIIGAVTGKATGSVVLDRERVADAAPADLHGANREAEPAPLPVPIPSSQKAPPPVPPTPAAHGKAEPEAVELPSAADEREQPDAPVQLATPAPAAAPAPAPAASPVPTRTVGPAPGAASRPAVMPSPAPLRGLVPTFIMETIEGRQGVLVTDERPETPGLAFLDHEGFGRIEVPFIELRCVTTR